MTYYEDLVFQQGDDASVALNILIQRGEQAALEHLRDNYDYGEASLLAEPPWGETDGLHCDGDYIMSFDVRCGHISLVRRAHLEGMYNERKLASLLRRAKTVVHDVKTAVISDGYVALCVTKKMLPSIVSVFGHLDGGYIRDGRKVTPCPDTKFIFERATKAVTVVDSGLMFKAGRTTVRVLYDPVTGDKIIVNQKYVDLFKNFKERELVSNNLMVQVVCGQAVIGAIALIRPQAVAEDRLAQFEFIKGGD